MRNNQLIVMLALVLFMSAAGNAWFTFRYVWSIHRLQELQPKVAQANSARNLVTSLISDTAEYAKKNPDIVPMMQSFFQSPVASAAPGK